MQTLAQTLEQIGTPWAETYRGNGRLTGRLAAEPVRMADGDVAPDWYYVGSQTPQEFDAAFEREQHDHCHTRPEWGCTYCTEEGNDAR